ncbi:MAG: lysophospholipase [Ignavibacteriales bacterium]|nr:lysophospholipase [Ignavibacteriales bacterium]
MENVQFGWKTEDGLNIFAQIWIPDVEVKAVVCLVHGLGEHSSRYKELPIALTSAGYALISYDQRGHGKSEGKRGHTPSYEASLSDVSKLLNEAAKRFPDKKLFLYGHSMGGNLVINYVLRNISTDLAGVIVTGPWLKLCHPPNSIMNNVASFLNNYWPSFISFNGLKSSDLSKEKIKLEVPEKDKYIHPWISARTFVSVRDAGEWALSHAEDFNLPLLILHGGSDRVTSPEASRRFAAKVKTDCTLIVFDELYHEIHNEARRDEIFIAIVSWLNNHTK